MAQLNVRRSYGANTPLLKQDLDAFIDDIETFINVTRLNNDNFQDDSITASDKILVNTFAGEKFVNGAFTTAKITDANVTTAKIADGAVTTAKILDSNVTTAKIADNAVTLTKIADGSITFDKMSEGYTTATRAADTRADTQVSFTYTKLVDLDLTTVASDAYVIVEGQSGYSICSDTTASGTAAGATDEVGANFLLARKPQGGATSTVLGFVSYSKECRRGPTSASFQTTIPLNALKFIVSSPGAGAYTYSVYVAPYSLNAVNTVVGIFNIRKLSK